MRECGVQERRRVVISKEGKKKLEKLIVMVILMVGFMWLAMSYMNLRTDLIIYKEDIQKLREENSNLVDEMYKKEEKIREYREVLGVVKKRDVGGKFVASRCGRGRKVERAKFEVSMYTNEEGYWEEGSPHWGTMRNGEKTHLGVVAAPECIAFGSNIVFDNIPEEWESVFNRIFEVKDRGSEIKEKEVDGEKVYCIDVYIGDRDKAFEWGRRTVDGYIIKDR